ncbi:putative glycine-rich cell wall structural protein 1 [Helianthus annuus]|uniref:putative glycine-rich cell wall structural protein 1 n=1 Tax=Helianthus annuus TaxID=4232 RepID=UPI000B8FB5FC|nr:putative glycine-rich cell wall structural protein 1 [Helianthus annuus]
MGWDGQGVGDEGLADRDKHLGSGSRHHQWKGHVVRCSRIGSNSSSGSGSGSGVGGGGRSGGRSSSGGHSGSGGSRGGGGGSGSGGGGSKLIDIVRCFENKLIIEVVNDCEKMTNLRVFRL